MVADAWCACGEKHAHLYLVGLHRRVGDRVWTERGPSRLRRSRRAVGPRRLSPELIAPSDASAVEPSCAASVSTATHTQVDIVFLIDTSGSMGEEAAQVQQNLNDFAQSIEDSGLDYNVILIGTKTGTLPPIFGGLPIPTVCVPPPLGGPDCSDGPRFHHLNEGIGSTDSLQDILDYYPKYEGWLRPSAYKARSSRSARRVTRASSTTSPTA